MAPAMRVAVRDGFSRHQALGVLQRLDDNRAGFPDIQTAKQGQFVHVAAIALHGVQDVVSREAVSHAAVKVFYAISGR